MPSQSLNLHSPTSSFGTSVGFMDAVRPILPVLRAYGRRLTGNVSDSDDLVQDTLVRAWGARARFQPGTNLKAWMMRIQRNSFLSGRRRASLQVELDPEALDRRMTVVPAQEEQLHLEDLGRAIDALPDHQRRAFTAISQGTPYAELAVRLGISEGTLKSRVSRARFAIVTSLDTAKSIRERPESRPEHHEKPRGRYEKWKQSGARMIG